YSSDLDIKAVFDEVRIELTDILHLRVDDVIHLEKKVDSDIKLTIDGEPWFAAKLGSVKTNKAVKITKMYQ
ncbi:MAG: FliM/FliN family flagellar motor switch protein, partial [Oscillospiraceae bacterium]|nr:FliM/FliN family flagellar motor switch protein [Oscillospiraceae bacterium]